jgi:hypothetical protein
MVLREREKRKTINKNFYINSLFFFFNFLKGKFYYSSVLRLMY